jgi:L-alanine-DL-glutamate epimerase-like enolase superfamily enzyme
MRITAVRAYRQHQPFVEGSYGTAGGSVTGYDSTIVAVDTDEGVTGWGEMAPLGSFYSEAFPAGVRAGVAELAPALIGHDPAQPRRITEVMDAAMRGQPYVKSALDMACWDAAARAQGRPLCEALGGRFGDSVDLYHAIPPMAPADAAATATRYVSDGYRRLQVKVGGDPALDAERVAAVRDAVGTDIVLFADANAAWTTGAALRFLSYTTSLDYTLEQPCRSLGENRTIRAHCQRPLVLDESIVSLDALLEAWRHRIADGVTIKLSRVGGVTRASAIRDVAVELGLEVTVEDTGGATIDTAAMLHLGLSTPQRQRLHMVDFTSWVTVGNADGLPAPRDGRLAAPDAPGLGITVREADLGDPFVTAG